MIESTCRLFFSKDRCSRFGLATLIETKLINQTGNLVLTLSQIELTKTCFQGDML